MLREWEDWPSISNNAVQYDISIGWMVISSIGFITTSERSPTMHKQILVTIYTGRIMAKAS